MEITNWCEFFRQIELHPKAKIKGMTIRKLMQARLHIQECDICFNRSERVNSQAPKEDYKDMFKEN